MPDRTARYDGEETRARLLHYLYELEAEGIHPTAVELSKRSGISRSNVRHHIPELAAAGLITFREVPTKAMRREIVLTGKVQP